MGLALGHIICAPGVAGVGRGTRQLQRISVLPMQWYHARGLALSNCIHFIMDGFHLAMHGAHFVFKNRNSRFCLPSLEEFLFGRGSEGRC